MTVGLTINNGHEAVAITDSQGTFPLMGRETNTMRKLFDFKNDGYHGVMFFAGSSGYSSLMEPELARTSAETLDEFVEKLQVIHAANFNRDAAAHLSTARADIDVRAHIFPEGSPERQQFVEQAVGRALHEYEENRRNADAMFGTQYIITGREGDEIRSYSFSSGRVQRILFPHLEIGSGMDGANAHLNRVLQGIDTRKLNTADLLAFGMDAYSVATGNQGVGGTPQIAIIKGDRVSRFTSEQACIAANVSGIFLAGVSPDVDYDRAKAVYASLIDVRPNLQGIHDVVGMTVDAFRSTLVPYSSWQERAGQARFEPKPVSTQAPQQ